MKLLFWLNRKFMAMRFLPGMVCAGIALSVAALLVTLGVAQGFEKEFKKALLNFYAHITLPADPAVVLSEAEVHRALKEAGVTAYTLQPFLYREALMVHQGKIHGVVLKGVPGMEGLRLGKALSEKLGPWTVDRGPWTIKFLLPNNKTVQLEVTDTFQTGLYELDDQFALIGLDPLRRLFGLEPTVQGYEIRLPDPDQAPALAKKLSGHLPPFLMIQNWADDNRPLLEAFRLEKWFFRLLIGFMIAVAVLNLVAAILLSIFRKKRSIAILQALGMTARQIRLLFTLEGFCLGAVGIGLGLLAGGGLLFSLARFHWVDIDAQVYFLEKLPIDFCRFDVLMISFLSFLFVVTISWWVAGRSAAIPIREGLHEPI